MFITEMYKVRVNGIVKVMSEIPEGAEILETLTILNAEDGYDLIRIADEENMGSSVWLKEGDSQDNYREEEQLDMIYWDKINGTNLWAEKITEIKNKYPKEINNSDDVLPENSEK